MQVLMIWYQLPCHICLLARGTGHGSPYSRLIFVLCQVMASGMCSGTTSHCIVYREQLPRDFAKRQASFMVEHAEVLNYQYFSSLPPCPTFRTAYLTMPIISICMLPIKNNERASLLLISIQISVNGYFSLKQPCVHMYKMLSILFSHRAWGDKINKILTEGNDWLQTHV